MKYILETDFDKIYDALNEYYLTEAASYKETLWRKIKDFTKEEWESFNNPTKRILTLNDITMNLPSEVKEIYCNELNKYAKENNGWLSPYYYFDEETDSMDKLAFEVDNICHIHHIDFKELVPDRTYDIHNFIALSNKQHTALHNTLAVACKKYLKQHQDITIEERQAIGVCIGADRTLQRFAGDEASAVDLSNNAKSVQAGIANRDNYSNNFSADAIETAKNSDYIKGIHGTIESKGLYLFIGRTGVETLVSDLSLDKCLNGGLPYKSVSEAGRAINRTDKLLSTQAGKNHKIISAEAYDFGLYTTKAKDDNGDFILGQAIIPIYKTDWEKIKEG